MTTAQINFPKLSESHKTFIKTFGFISFAIEVEAGLVLHFASDFEELCRLVRQEAK